MTSCQHCGRQHPAGPACPITGDSMSAPGLIGTSLDRYRIEALLGSGGFGAVYRARHVHTDSVVALKVLKRNFGTDAAMVERFLREAKAAAAVGSNHIVRVLDAGQAAGLSFLVMEYLEGMDLKELSEREGPLPVMRLVLLTLQVLEGLEAAHKKNIVHRDMKPANVFVARQVNEAGVERDFVKVLDFGISKMHGGGEQSGLTMTGVAMGTPSYMSPEQFFDARNVDARADLYSVSVMLYQLLTGKLPFEATSSADLIVKVRTEVPPSLQLVAPHVPIGVANAVMVGLAREKEKRWGSARELATALRQAMGLPSTAAALPSPRPSAPTPVTPGLSMMLGDTSTPSSSPSASAGSAQAWGAPPAVPPAVADWKAPTPNVIAAQTPHTPPARVVGVLVPGAEAAPLAAVKKNNTTMWVLILIGAMLVFGGCCVCAGVLASASEQAQQDEQHQHEAEGP